MILIKCRKTNIKYVIIEVLNIISINKYEYV